MENENVVDEFDAGFLDVTPTLTETPAEEVPVETPVEEAPKIVSITEEQFKQMQEQLAKISQIEEVTTKRFDTAFGKLGGLERVLNQLQSSTPEGESVSVSKEDFAELASEYPEIAELQAAGLNKVLSKLKGTGKAPAFDHNQLNQLIEEKVGAVKKEFTQQLQLAEYKSLDLVREDWRDVIGLPGDDNVIPDTEFRRWLAAQSPAYQEEVNSTDDSRVIVKAIAAFEKSKQTVSTSQKSDRARQLQAAANTPRSAGGNPTGPSEDDDFDAGFRS